MLSRMPWDASPRRHVAVHDRQADARTTMTAPSARSLLLTVLGDAVLPSGGRAWLGALTNAMETVAVTAPATRQALRRLAGQDLVAAERHGRRTAYRLTSPGRRRLEEAAERIYLRRELRWDGRWRLLTYTFPEEHRAARDALRRELAWLGYGTLSSGLMISPWDHGAHLDAVLAKHGVEGAVETFTSELQGDDRDLAARAYDLAGLRREHRAFIDDVEGRPTSEDVRRVDDRASFGERILLVHRWRKFLFLDPGLPQQLLPTDWLGDRAAAAYLDLYRRLEPGAWRHWERICEEADPDGRTPDRPRSNLDPVTEGHAGEGAVAGADAGDVASSGGVRADQRRTEEFLERVHAGQRIEATEWMPETYRRMNLKFIEMHANSEIMGALPEREWIPRAPSLRRKRSLAAKVQDEVGHAHLIYRVAESLGKPREEMFEDLIHGRTSFHNVFHYPTHSWGDVACIGFLVDGAAIVTQQALLKTSYAPYARVMRRVVAEESLHYRHGEDVMLALASGDDEQFEMLQEAVTRWWEPIMHFFGTDVGRDEDPMIHWGVKSQTNEESRQAWLSQYVPKLWDMGLELPDPALAWDAGAGAWHYTEPDWDRLRAIVKGEPTEATAGRLHMRRTMQRNHDWIRGIVTGDGAPVVAV
jgi:ring-1,2-phenylacetyl-CoA epoxidase subunit PaaA